MRDFRWCSAVLARAAECEPNREDADAEKVRHPWTALRASLDWIQLIVAAVVVESRDDGVCAAVACGGSLDGVATRPAGVPIARLRSDRAARHVDIDAQVIGRLRRVWGGYASPASVRNRSRSHSQPPHSVPDRPLRSLYASAIDS